MRPMAESHFRFSTAAYRATKRHSLQALGLCLALVPLLFSQGLEEHYMAKQKSLSQQDAHSQNAQVIDSLRRAGMIAAPGTKIQNMSSDFNGDTIANDSLLARPDTSLDKASDTLLMRYTQMIFKKAPSSLFSAGTQGAGRSHTLGAGDQIKVSLWGDKEAQYSLKINPAGKVYIEGIGLVQVAGYSVEKAEEKLRNKLSTIYSGIQRGTTFVEISDVQAGPIKVFLLGEVNNPGGYTFQGNQSVFAALYYAKGPNAIGSVRKMKLTRGGQEYILDLYDYLLKGKSITPDRLLDGDVLFLERAHALVTISGAIGRPAIYELKKGEDLNDLISFAGGLNTEAMQKNLTISRIMENGRRDYLPLENKLDGKTKIELRDGDEVFIPASSERSHDFFQIVGPVKYPGKYSIQGITSVKQAVEKAGGVQEEAYLGRIHIVRFMPDGTSEIFAYNLSSTTLESIQITPRDLILLYNQKDMVLSDSVEISGAVFTPKKFSYSKGMTVKDLILLAGGLKPYHKIGKAIVYRPIDRQMKVKEYVLEISPSLDNEQGEFILEARDLVFIPIDENWYTKELVVLEGEFKFPGKYSLLYPGEKLSSVIERTGGFKEKAYIPGFRFYRHKDKIGRMGIDLKKALKSPKDAVNIQLQNGDSLFIPETMNHVKVIGEVGFPNSVLYKKGKSETYYVKRAGGFTSLSDKKHIVVEYANGETAGGDIYRDPDPGSTVFVPVKDKADKINWGNVINGTIGTLSAAAALILSLIIISEKT